MSKRCQAIIQLFFLYDIIHLKEGVISLKIHESGENYLERILMLKENNQTVRSIDLAKEMNFSKPSVSRAVKQLKESGYITIEDSGYIEFTNAGYQYAKRIYERHQFFTDFLLYLGVEPEIASEDACRIEHVLSVESYLAIKKFVQEKKNCEPIVNE